MPSGPLDLIADYLTARWENSAATGTGTGARLVTLEFQYGADSLYSTCTGNSYYSFVTLNVKHLLSQTLGSPGFHDSFTY